jgi:hypothetical protein
VIYPGSTPVGNATLVVANVLTCNKYSQKKIFWIRPDPQVTQGLDCELAKQGMARP